MAYPKATQTYGRELKKKQASLIKIADGQTHYTQEFSVRDTKIEGFFSKFIMLYLLKKYSRCLCNQPEDNSMRKKVRNHHHRRHIE